MKTIKKMRVKRPSLRSFKKRSKARSKKDLHEQLKRTIMLNPLLIGLAGVINVQEEVLCKGADGNTVCEPDLIFLLSNGQKVLVEVKSTDHPTTLESLEDQLKRGHKFFKENHNEEYLCIGVYRDRKGNIKTL